MAEIIDPPSSARGGDPHGRKSKYPWKEWTDGHWRLAVSGVDYTCKDGSFQFVVYQQGYRRGLQAQTRVISGKGVAFRFIPKKGGMS
ncbi:MAG: hypothetical protein HOV84_17495 [Streptomyces sp.]|nr:hypothetical protein [Streptomyces sp.]